LNSAPRNIEFTLDVSRWPPRDSKKVLLCREAFISGPAHSMQHQQDTRTAVSYFYRYENNLLEMNAVVTDSTLCLIGAAALWSG